MQCNIMQPVCGRRSDQRQGQPSAGQGRAGQGGGGIRDSKRGVGGAVKNAEFLISDQSVERMRAITAKLLMLTLQQRLRDDSDECDGFSLCLITTISSPSEDSAQRLVEGAMERGQSVPGCIIARGSKAGGGSQVSF